MNEKYSNLPESGFKAAGLKQAAKIESPHWLISAATVLPRGAQIVAALPESVASDAARSLVWEVFPEADHDPLRFGLCLLKAGCREVRVPVIGLNPGVRYRFRLIDADRAATEAQFETLPQTQVRYAA